jgi:hypothetical protein
MNKLIVAVIAGFLLVAAAPTRAAEGMMDDPKKMEQMKQQMEATDKAMEMMKKAMAQKDEAMAKEAKEMLKKALAEWNKGDPMKGF